SPPQLAANCFLLTAYDYLITLSALASTFGGIVRPICFAVFRLMMNSNFFGCSTGMSAGWLCSLQNLVHKSDRAPVEVIEVRPVGHEAALIDKLLLEINTRQAVFVGKLHI